MKNLKKILASLLVVVMVLTAAPLSGFVGLELPDFYFGIRASAANELATTGQCGDNVYWNYDSAIGELVISGEGPMWDYINYSHISPFCDSNIMSVVIKDGVTSIGDRVFFNCTMLKSISIPDSVELVGDGSFLQCYKLEKVTIPNSVLSIGNSAFYNCSNLRSIVLPHSIRIIERDAFAFSGFYNSSENWKDNVLYIDEYLIDVNYTISGVCIIKEGTLTIAEGAFNNCTNLTRVIIPDSVRNIGDYAFENCVNLLEVSIGNCVENINSSVFVDCINITELTIGVKEIPAEIFNNKNRLKKVTLTENVEIIGDRAFANCPYLETINFPDSLKYMGKDILKNTAWFNYRGKGLIIYDDWAYGFKGLENNTIVNLPVNVKGVADRTFTGNSDILAFEVDPENQYFSSENGVLFNKEKTILIAYPIGKSEPSFTIPNTVEEILDEAFYRNRLSTIRFGDNIRKIGSFAFSSLCGEKFIFISSIESWCQIDFEDATSNPMFEGLSTLYINNEYISSIEIPDDLSEIKQYTFINCSNIEYISIPDSITSIGADAFSMCRNLKYINIPECVITIGNSAFAACNSLTDITIPDGVIEIGNSAFSYCDSVKSITLGKDIKTIGDSAFYIKNLKDVFYLGSQEDWEKLDKGDNNYLINANLYLMHRHDYTITVTKEPTCTTEGTALYECVHGDTKTEVIQPLGHTWDEGKITADSSCSKGGTKTYTCTVCFEKKYETIETLDHDYQLRESYAPTCDKVGYDIYVCTQCSAKETRETAPSLGHDFSTEFTVDIDSTCTMTGIKSKHCKRTGCKETTDETVIPLKDHAWQSDVTVTKVPTCTAEGESVILCKDCKIVKPESNKVIAPLGHNASEQEFTVDVEATCVSFGKQSKHCTRCNYIEQATQIPMSEHDYYVAEESTATCNKPGIAIYVCRMCKDSYTVENSPALGHDFEYIIIETPTCTREGYEYGDCTRCDATETRPVPTIDHDYIRTEVSPTCLDDGLATYTCSYGCGKTYDEVIPALGHSYPANWVTILPATCTERGSAIKICRACSEVMSQVMPKLSHTDSNSDGVCDECGFGGESKPDTPEEPDAPEEPDTPEVPDTPDIPDKPEEKPCDCDCHAGGIKAFFFKLINFFAKIFDKDARTCECGVAH